MGKETFRLHKFATAILAFLIIQFILGMTLNLFTTFPNIPGGTLQPSQYIPIFTQYPVLLVHYLLGIALFFMSMAMLVLSRVQKRIFLIALLGFLAVFGALISGLEFMFNAFQNNTFSFTMSIGFIVALIAYFAMFYETRKD